MIHKYHLTRVRLLQIRHEDVLISRRRLAVQVFSLSLVVFLPFTQVWMNVILRHYQGPQIKSMEEIDSGEMIERWKWTNMALLAVELDRAVLEITPHLEHFRSSRLRASAGTLRDMCTHTMVWGGERGKVWRNRPMCGWHKCKTNQRNKIKERKWTQQRQEGGKNKGEGEREKRKKGKIKTRSLKSSSNEKHNQSTKVDSEQVERMWETTMLQQSHVD